MKKAKVRPKERKRNTSQANSQSGIQLQKGTAIRYLTYLEAMFRYNNQNRYPDFRLSPAQLLQ